VDIDVLLGHAPATVDEKGRIKIPSAFRKVFEQRWGTDCFMTSFEGDNAVIYPLAVWQETLSRLGRVPSTSRAKIKYLERANYYGQLGTMDAQGRLLVPTVLRSVAGISEEVVVLGSNDHLIVWNEARMQKRLSESPMTDEDYKELELHGV
jgi:MraZ protein